MSDIEVVEPLAVGTVPNVAPDQPITSAWGNTVADTINGRALNVPACRVYNNANIPVPHNVTTALTFNTERFDSDTMHDLAVSTGRITFKTAGLYVVNLHVVVVAANDYSTLKAAIRFNGTTDIGAATLPQNTQVIENPYLQASCLFKFAVGEYVDAAVYQHNTANATRNVLTMSATSPEFSAVWVGTG